MTSRCSSGHESPTASRSEEAGTPAWGEPETVRAVSRPTFPLSGVTEAGEHVAQEPLHPRPDPLRLALPRSRHVDDLKPACLDPGEDLRRPGARVDDIERLPELPAGVEGQRAAGRVPVAEPGRCVGVADVGHGPRGVAGLGALDQTPPGQPGRGDRLREGGALVVEGALGQPPLRRPPAGFDPRGAGGAECGLVGPGLPPCDDPGNHWRGSGRAARLIPGVE
jgi:hypothetical protein